MEHADQVSGRERILEEAAALFVRRGYRETTLRDIAAAAGMKAGSIYYHFDAKADLLAAVLETGIERITGSFLETAAALPAELAPRDRLRRHVHTHLAALFEHGPFTTSHVTVFHAAPEAVRALGTPSRDAYERLWTNLLQEFAAAGHLRPGLDLGLQRILLLGAANSTLDWFDPSGGRPLEELATALTARFWFGVAEPDGAGRPAAGPAPRAARRSGGATPSQPRPTDRSARSRTTKEPTP